MPLIDHFHPPLSDRRHWHAFHNSWATYVSSQLNALLPEGYFAEANVQYGIEIDVATFEESDIASLVSSYTPPQPDSSIPLNLSGSIVEVGIFSRSGGPTLSAAIELVSPANKYRAGHRDALTTKCVTYLQAGVGLILVDVVTDRTADLHAELLTRLGSTPTATVTPLFAAAYRPVERDGQTTLDIWHESLIVGQSLPTLPLWLRGGYCVPIDFEASYMRTCNEQRIQPAA